MPNPRVRNSYPHHYGYTLRYLGARHLRGTETASLFRFARAWDRADFPTGYFDPCISVHFPLGTYPQLYRESWDQPAPRHGFAEREPHGYKDKFATRGHYRSRYALPLKRATWITQGRNKPSLKMDGMPARANRMTPG